SRPRVDLDHAGIYEGQYRATAAGVPGFAPACGNRSPVAWRPMPGPAVLDTLRAQLEDERASLRRQLTDLGAGDTAPSFDANFADSGQVAAEQGETRLVLASLTDQLR